MLPRADDITGTRPVVLIEATAPATALGQSAQDALNLLSQLTLGKEYQGQILSRLTDGTFLVKVGNAVASMALPPETKVGDTVELTLLASQPRATFLLGTTADVTTTTSLSDGARLIGNLLQLAQRGGMPTTVVGKTPLVLDPNAPASQIASALHDAVTFSGLFYESHVAQWAAGTRPTADLLREPAAKLIDTSLPGAAHAAPTDAKSGDLSKLMNNVRAWVGGERTLSDLLHTAASDDPAQQTTQSAATQQQSAPIGDGVKLISLQLDTLEQQRIAWQGELFPGQPMQWEISDETPQRQGGRDETEASWRSSVRFTLPTLGSVSASIRLTGSHVQVQVTAPNEETAAALRAHGHLLATALDAAGSPLDSLLVKQDG